MTEANIVEGPFEKVTQQREIHYSKSGFVSVNRSSGFTSRFEKVLTEANIVEEPFEKVTREKEQIHYFKFSFVNRNGGFTSRFKKVFEHHYATLFCQYLSFSVQSYQYVFPLAFSISYSVVYALFFSTSSKFNALLNTSSLSLLKTCPYHRTPLAQANPSKLSFKPSKLVSSWLLFSINFTPHIVPILFFSLFQFFSKFPSHSPSNSISEREMVIIIHEEMKEKNGKEK